MVTGLVLPAIACRRPSAQDKPAFIAKTYLTAFLQGDYKTAASLLHPIALEGVRAAFLDGLSKARVVGGEKDYLDALGGHPSSELESLTSVDLFVALREGADKVSRPDFEFRKKTKLEVISTQFADSGKATVRLKCIPSAESPDLSFEDSFELLLAGSEWKVLREVHKSK